jgi:hypothetical protein
MHHDIFIKMSAFASDAKSDAFEDSNRKTTSNNLKTGKKIEPAPKNEKKKSDNKDDDDDENHDDDELYSEDKGDGKLKFVKVWNKYTATKTYEGSVDNGLEHGHGKVTYDPSYKDYHRDKYSDKVSLQYTNCCDYVSFDGQWFQGDIEDDEYGTMVFSNGSIYKGNIDCGVPSDEYGRLEYKNGNVYEGQFEGGDNWMCGRGKLTLNNPRQDVKKVRMCDISEEYWTESDFSDDEEDDDEEDDDEEDDDEEDDDEEDDDIVTI